MKRTVRVLVLAVIAGLLALTGCAGRNPTTVAEVNGVVITEAEVDLIARGLGAGDPDAVASARSTAASVLVGNEITRQVGAMLGVSVPDADVQQMISGTEELAQLAAVPELADFVAEYVVMVLLVNQVGEEVFLTAAAGVSVVVNPRYGEFDPNTLQLTGGSGSLSRPAFDPAAGA